MAAVHFGTCSTMSGRLSEAFRHAISVGKGWRGHLEGDCPVPVTRSACECSRLQPVGPCVRRGVLRRARLRERVQHILQMQNGAALEGVQLQQWYHDQMWRSFLSHSQSQSHDSRTNHTFGKSSVSSGEKKLLKRLTVFF